MRIPLAPLWYKLAGTLWGSLASCGRLSIGPLPRSQPTGGGNQPPRRLSTCPTSMAYPVCHKVTLESPTYTRIPRVRVKVLIIPQHPEILVVVIKLPSCVPPQLRSNPHRYRSE